MSSHKYRSSLKVRAIVSLMIFTMLAPLPSSQAAVIGSKARQSIGSLSGLFNNLIKLVSNKEQDYQGQTFVGYQDEEDLSERNNQVTLFQLCPRYLSLYVGETYTLTPTPLDNNREVVHGVVVEWQSNDQSIATITSNGEVTAVTPGHTMLTVLAGTTRAKVLLEVRAGARRPQSDLEWGIEHASDCLDPEADPIDNQTSSALTKKKLTTNTASTATDENNDISYLKKGESFKKWLRPISYTRKSANNETHSALATSITPIETKAASIGRISRLYFTLNPIDGSTADGYSAAAANTANNVGIPRFIPQLAPSSSSTSSKAKDNLGSYNYTFSAPVLSLGGRGSGIDLSLTYNSRIWNIDSSTNTMSFNYAKGWPSAGWSLGYGRIIRNYDNTLSGDGSGTGSANAPGNYLLVQRDGTRIPLQQSYDSTAGVWKFDSTDGTFIHYNLQNGKLKYPDGTVILYNLVNNRLLPTLLQDRNGNQINISYRSYNSSTFPNRWAIDQITDTMGRHVVFHYYGDDTTTYVSNSLNKPAYALATITTPDYATGTRTLLWLDYKSVALSYNFGAMTVNNSPGSALTVINRIYYPATGRGFQFLGYSNYGMINYISERYNMTGSVGETDGDEIAFTKYTFAETGTLSDSPQYTQRSEWWLNKTDDTGAATSSPTVYNYARTYASSPLREIDTITYPNNLKVVTKTDNDPVSQTYGKVLTTIYRDATTSTIWRQLDYTYTFPSDGGIQLASVTSTDEAGKQIQTTYDYGSYGRLANVYEYGYANAGGSFTLKRKTSYQYLDTPSYINAYLQRLVTKMEISNGTNVIARTVYAYDGSSLMDYPSANYPPNHDNTNFAATNLVRGNVTSVQTWSNIASNISTTHTSSYDVFGNLVYGQISSTRSKSFSFSNGTYYSQPDSVTDAGTDGTSLTTSYNYNFNTGLVFQVTDSDNHATSFNYDSAWRVSKVTPALDTASTYIATSIDKDSFGNDLPAMSKQVSYKELDGTVKVITTKSWFDGAGRTLRTGAGSGASPTTFDTTATVYDSLGRVLKTSNPYSGDSSGNGTTSYWTSNTYDLLSRVTKITLPDNQTIQTTFNGAITTIKDPVGRQRQNQLDGLGRVISVTEENPTTGALDATNWQTTYSYDLLDKLISSNQGGQTRTYNFDALGQITSQTTPETGTTSYTYTDFGAILKRTDARNVETHYAYDGLDRLTHIWYTGPGGDDAGTIKPVLPSGVISTPDITMTYRTTSPAMGKLNSITDAAGTVNMSYDNWSRLSSKSRSIGSYTYTTQYQYNTFNQLALLIYNSGTRIRTNFDGQGRFSGVDSVNASNDLLAQYLSSASYDPAGHLTGYSLGNGIVENYYYSPDRMQQIEHKVSIGATALMDLNYSYTAAAGDSGYGTTIGNSGQLMGITSPNSKINSQLRNETFTYDTLGRLVTASGWGSWQRRYAYDRWNNRTGVWNATSGGTQIQSVSLVPTGSVNNNQIASITDNGVLYTYSQYSGGNVTNDGIHSYQYDAENRLAKVDNGTTATFTYDSDNHRVNKVTSVTSTNYVWEGNQLLAEYNGTNNTLLQEYINGGGKMIAQTSGTNVSYSHQDLLSTRMITDKFGSWTATQSNMPFGEQVTETGTQSKWHFATFERDSESNTDYVINRQYGIVAGRFMQPDKVVGNLLDPQTLNRYSYVGNDPVNRTDPDGLYPRDQHQFVTFLMASLLQRPDALGISNGAGAADNFYNAATGLLGVGYFKNFSTHFGIPLSTEELRKLSGFELGFKLHLTEDNSIGGPHRFFEGTGLGKRILSSIIHIGLNLVFLSPDTNPHKQGGWEAAWLGMGGDSSNYPEDLIKFITGTVNSNGLKIVGVEVRFDSGSGNSGSTGNTDLTGAEWIAAKYSIVNGIPVMTTIWKLPTAINFYDDPIVQAIQRQFSLPGSNPLAEGEMLYEYQLKQAGFINEVGGWNDFDTWFNTLKN